MNDELTDLEERYEAVTQLGKLPHHITAPDLDPTWRPFSATIYHAWPCIYCLIGISDPIILELSVLRL